MNNRITRHLTSCFCCLVAVTATLVGCVSGNEVTEGEEMMFDGVYEGIGEGRSGMIKVALTVQDHAIASARVVTQSESSFAQEALLEMVNRIVAAQGVDGVDAVSGATLTSNGVMQAMGMAIDAAYGRHREVKDYEDTSCDVVVVGAGGAGLSAAIEAASQGCHVIVLEKRSYIGGNTNSSTGGINAAGTPFQQALGIEDSEELFYKDIMEGGHYLNDPLLVSTLVRGASPTLQWLSSFGTDLTSVGLMGGSSVPRTHRPQGGTAIGPHLMKMLSAKATELGIEIRTGNTVTDVKRRRDGSAGGVTVRLENGKRYTIFSKAVVLATGGFGANLSMVTEYRSDLVGFSTVNHIGATGDAFKWVDKFGAELYQMDQIQVHPTVEVKNNLMITEAVRGNGAILLNRDGYRFVNELQTRDVVSWAILSQRGGTAFLLFDQDLRKSLSSIETYVSQGLLTEGNTLGELAGKVGIDPGALQQSVERYNAFQGEGEDEDFGRTSTQMPRPISTAPYYIVEVKPAIHHTMGGIHIDDRASVLTTGGVPVGGLFAAGEVTGGVHGGNRLGGNGVADIVVFGKIAGESAARYASK